MKLNRSIRMSLSRPHMLICCWLCVQATGRLPAVSSARRRPGRFVPLVSNDVESTQRMSIANMTCAFFSQPLNHYDLPRNRSGMYQQRYCYYNGYTPAYNATKNSNDTTNAPLQYPILLYTGNESPLEMYINHTGLMWELAAQFQAQVVFLEHRYEGESVPSPRTPKCMAYASSIQALADLARFISEVLFQWPPLLDNNNDDDDTLRVRAAQPPTRRNRRRPVIAVGGSYGGMLSAWLRMRYPHLVAGAIAASAPIMGLPLATVGTSRVDTSAAATMDGAWNVIARGLHQSYPPDATVTALHGSKCTKLDGSTVTKNDPNSTNCSPPTVSPDSTTTNHCPTNLLATWPLIRTLGSQASGRDLLTRIFRLCHPLNDLHSSKRQPKSLYTPPMVNQLLDWLSSPWFDLAEGSFPYPSSYIPFALTHHTYALPAWPLQAACWTHSQLFVDHGVRINGNVSNVSYAITYGGDRSDADELTVHVEWDAHLAPTQLEQLLSSSTVMNLLTSVRDAVSIWYNISQDVQCYDVNISAPNEQFSALDHQLETDVSQETMRHRHMLENIIHKDNATARCATKMKAEGSWQSLCCNEEMNLIITDAMGLGRDVMWPPSVPRGVTTYEQFVDYRRKTNGEEVPCLDPGGVYGYPQDDPDPWSTGYEEFYGGRHISTSSNIVFSNGLLDPWSAAGVYTTNPFIIDNISDWYFQDVNGLIVQNITDQDVISVIMELGGHHTDLMHSHNADPPCIYEARAIERGAIGRWIVQFWALERRKDDI